MILKIDELRRKVNDIWKKLDISNDELISYLAVDSGYNKCVLDIVNYYFLSIFKETYFYSLLHSS